MHNELSKKYNELSSTVDLLKSENAHLSKRLKEEEGSITVREAELKRFKQRAEYYEDKSSSIEMYITVKVRTEMMREYLGGKASSWDTEAEFKS